MIDGRGYILGEWVGINLVGGWVFSFLFLIFPFLIFCFMNQAPNHRDSSVHFTGLIYRTLASYKPSLTAYICGGGGGGREDRNGSLFVLGLWFLWGKILKKKIQKKDIKMWLFFFHEKVLEKKNRGPDDRRGCNRKK